jgi:cell division protease FtsH
MSDSIGAVTYDADRGAKFLDNPFAQERGVHAEETAREIDAEVKRILGEAHNEARRVLRERRDILDELSKRLLDREVIEGEELRALLGPVPPKDPEGTVPATVPAPDAKPA